MISLPSQLLEIVDCTLHIKIVDSTIIVMTLQIVHSTLSELCSGKESVEITW